MLSLKKKEILLITYSKCRFLDFKRRKEAELLILGDLPIEYNLGFLVYNENAIEVMTQKGIEDKLVVVKPNYYF